MRSEIGIPCYHCHRGVFMGSQWFTFWRDDFDRWYGTPREDLDVEALEMYRSELAEHIRSTVQRPQ